MATREKRYARVVERMNVRIAEVERNFNRSQTKRDKELLEYLKLRRSRYIL